MTWSDRLKDSVPLAQRADFLTDLQCLVAALREDLPWQLTQPLRDHPHLVLGYLTPGPKRDAVAAAFERLRFDAVRK